MQRKLSSLDSSILRPGGRRACLSPSILRGMVAAVGLMLVLAGCTQPGAGTQSASPKDVSLQGIPTAVWEGISTAISGACANGGARCAAYLIMSFGYSNALTILGLLEATLASWDTGQPAVYSVPPYTYSWSRNGSTWSWTITYVDGNQVTWTYVITLTATSSGWDVNVTEDGEQWLGGSVSSDGSNGNVVFQDPSQQYSGSLTTTWQPDQSPYVWKFTFTGTGGFALLAGNGATTATVVLDADISGQNWYYVYSDSAGGSDQYPVL